MVIYFKLKNGYLEGYGSTPNNEEGEIKLEISDDHEVLRNPEIFKYENGELIKDEERQKQLIEESNVSENRLTDDEVNAIALMELTEMVMGGGE